MGREGRAVKVAVRGVVQGVGFRPFVYRLASSLGLRGYVRNMGGSEAEIWLEGEDSKVEEFLRRLREEKPPPAKLEEVRLEEVAPAGHMQFLILESSAAKRVRSSIPPDIAICEDCAREVLSPGSRFSGYHWNSCAWCGPRFSMIYEIPYDRHNTAMRDFPLCEDCARDYGDPANARRFHAQGISCSRCGPKTFVLSGRGERISVEDAVEFIATAIEEGRIVAIKGVGGYHIASLASRDEVVAELRRRKRRPTKPFALMARDLEVVERIAEVPPIARELLLSPQRPIVLLPKKEGAPVSELVAPGLSSLGIMLPYTAFQLLLMQKVKDGFLIMTSANVHGRPMCTELDCVLRELSDAVDYVVEHERKIAHRADDSVVRLTDGEPVMLRRGRGYAPSWLQLPFQIAESAAVGAELQTAGAVAFEDKAVLTQYIGDVDEPATLEELEREVRWLLRAYDLRPAFVARDMHPLYHNRRLAEELAQELGASIVEVQHHHAHAAAAMVEAGVGEGERVAAIAIDGTGYASPGSIWGGEVLIASYESYERAGSIRPFSLPGGDSAAIYPAKPLVALMASYGYSEDEVLEALRRRGLLRSLPYGEKEAIVTYEAARRRKGVETSSLGRTLDAFSALLGTCAARTYEGEPPMLLESLAERGKRVIAEAEVTSEEIPRVSVRPLLEVALAGGAPREDVALSVQLSIGEALGRIAVSALKGRRGVRGDLLVVSGGAAVNTFILRGIRQAAREGGLRVFVPRLVPPNDGSIALGQLAVGHHLVR
ncbi:MAG: carbamoyltransferase HypF [Acidilobaceae archaeon]|nr:carbamoyltransferase HypF [Acidilobaceae archaeon]